jgi:hypothetical protein
LRYINLEITVKHVYVCKLCMSVLQKERLTTDKLRIQTVGILIFISFKIDSKLSKINKDGENSSKH